MGDRIIVKFHSLNHLLIRPIHCKDHLFKSQTANLNVVEFHDYDQF